MNVWWMCLAPQNITRVIVLTPGSKAVLIVNDTDLRTTLAGLRTPAACCLSWTPLTCLPDRGLWSQRWYPWNTKWPITQIPMISDQHVPLKHQVTHHTNTYNQWPTCAHKTGSDPAHKYMWSMTSMCPWDRKWPSTQRPEHGIYDQHHCVPERPSDPSHKDLWSMTNMPLRHELTHHPSHKDLSLGFMINTTVTKWPTIQGPMINDQHVPVRHEVTHHTKTKVWGSQSTEWCHCQWKTQWPITQRPKPGVCNQHCCVHEPPWEKPGACELHHK